MLSMRRIFALALAGITVFVLLVSAGSLAENIDAEDIAVIQAPISGDLTWYTTPGVKWQGWGKVTIYKKRSQYWFSSKPDQGNKEDQSLKIRFNDGGHATISGGVSWELPLDAAHLTTLHTQYGSQEAIEQHLVRTVVEKSVYMTGPMMSSTESYAGRRNELLYLVEDQMKNGICITNSKQHTEKDALTGIDKTVVLVEIATDEKGVAKRAEESPLKDFAIITKNLVINQIQYDETVEKQIQQQQQSTMAVQIAIADAKKAEQEVLTTKKKGEASAAEAEWQQRTIAAKQEQEATMKKNVATTLAEQELAVAELATKAAEQKKLADIALGEGESQRRTLVYNADGSLEKKLAAWTEVNKYYAESLGNYKGNLVPSVVMGNSGAGVASPGLAGGTPSSTLDLINLVTVKTALDLGLDTRMAKPASK